MSPENRIYNECLRQGIPALLAGFITAQAAHETGGFTSAVFISCNNCFGYDYIGQSTAAGPCSNHSPYAAYSSIEQSADELIAWIGRRQDDGIFPADLNSITNSDQYAQLLKDAGYYGDSVSNYAAGIRAWLNSLSLEQKAAGGGGLLVILLGAAYIFRKKLFGSKK